MVHSRYQIAGTAYKGVERANTEMEGLVREFFLKTSWLCFDTPTYSTQNERRVYLCHLRSPRKVAEGITVYSKNFRFFSQAGKHKGMSP